MPVVPLQARDKATNADNTLRKAEKAFAAFEVDLPKAQMEAEAERSKAADLEHRLKELKSATKVGGLANE